MKDFSTAPVPVLARDRARSLRQAGTEAERRLWRRLRNGQLKGVKFRRQHPVGLYIVDFFCLEARLVVELDGGQHDLGAEQRRDRQRTRYLEGLGYRVLRFSNNDVLSDTDTVLQRIEQQL